MLVAIEESTRNAILIAAKAALVFDSFACQAGCQAFKGSKLALHSVELTAKYIDASSQILQPLQQACNAIVHALSWLYCKPKECSSLLENSLPVPETSESASKPTEALRVPLRTSAWVPPKSFRRRTTKYWVSRQNLLRVKLAIAMHLPVLLLDNSSSEETCTDADASGAIPGAVMNSWQPCKISSVYYDNCSFKVYLDRLIREDGATLVRARWYGDVEHLSNAKQIFIERKCHRDFWTGEWSSKDREPISQVLAQFLSQCNCVRARSSVVARPPNKQPAKLIEIANVLIYLIYYTVIQNQWA
jgi:SPX domain protein involved in polyphosphate accumulation